MSRTSTIYMWHIAIILNIFKILYLKPKALRTGRKEGRQSRLVPHRHELNLVVNRQAVRKEESGGREGNCRYSFCLRSINSGKAYELFKEIPMD